MKLLRAVLFLSATVLTYLGVPLVGWGLAHLGGHFSSTPCLGYAVVVGLFSLAVRIQPSGSPFDHRQHIPLYPPSALSGDDRFVDRGIQYLSVLDRVARMCIFPGHPSLPD